MHRIAALLVAESQISSRESGAPYRVPGTPEVNPRTSAWIAHKDSNFNPGARIFCLPSELNRIAMEIGRQPGLYLPLPQGAPDFERKQGPAVCVCLKYPEIVLGAKSLDDLYWDRLRRTPVGPGMGVLATIN